MNRGVIQQIGTPDEIYDQPENVFVADFVGSPSMNLLEGNIKPANGSLVAEVKEITFDLSGYRWRETPADDQPVKVGFRPEHFLQPDEVFSGRTLRLDLPIDFLEKAGPDAIALLSVAGRTIAVRVDARTADRYRRDAKASVLLTLDKINVFNAETGRRM
jgi:multiple sugar transport system ATP-binding protein